MRLIDADELRAELSGVSYPIKTSNQGSVMGYSHSDVLSVIDVQPTAYDVDKVILKIENSSKLYSISEKDCEFAIPQNTALEIVKGGGQ